jgi:hypothetical protein
MNGQQNNSTKKIRKPISYTVKTTDSRTHAFNVGIATDFSPDMALWLGHLAFWAEKNLANEKNIHDGLVWSYDTLDALCDYLPYYTRRQIETTINNSIKEGLVQRGNYNKTSYDRTLWYALTPKAYFYFQHLLTDKYLNRLFLSISQICEMDFTEFVNGFPRSVTTIPNPFPDPVPNPINNISTGSNEPVIGNIIFDTDNGNEENKIVQTKEVNNKSSNRLTIDDLYDLNPHQIPYEMILDFLENRKAKRSPLTRTAWLKINKELSKSGNALNAFEEMVSRGWVSLNVDWLKSNNKRTEIDDNNTDWA